MARPVHFEIQADDLDRARTFYGDVFGWTFKDWSSITGSPYWGVITGEDGPGIDGGLMERPHPAPPEASGCNGAVLTMQVDDYDAAAARIEAAGGRVTMPKSAIPGMAWQGYYLDTEGNTFGLHQADEDAR
ncbi:VOC family protein [Oryzobacter sp. R7]|uniref:VOC family protein n=1 Tax=Oryzobacter faecalis TaxID=3388656 RepID=UPI00398CC019